MKTRNHAAIRFPYHKQGDDLAMAIERAKGDILAGLEAFARNAEATAKQATAIKEAIAEQSVGEGVKINANNHSIDIAGPADLIVRLCELGLADPVWPHFDELEEIALNDIE